MCLAGNRPQQTKRQGGSCRASGDLRRSLQNSTADSEPGTLRSLITKPFGRFAAPRMARAVIAAVVFGYILNTLLSAVAGGLRGAPLAGLLICLALAFGLQLAHSTRAPLTWPVWTRAATLWAQAAVTFLPFVSVGPRAGSLAGFLIGSVLLAVVGAWRWWLGAGLLVAVLAGSGEKGSRRSTSGTASTSRLSPV
jgi:hypothetical protein